MTDGDPRRRVLDAVAGELRVGPLARRRILAELADHLDDAVDDLRGAGVPRQEAIAEAVRRLGDPEAIADAFAVARVRAPLRSRLRARRSMAWIAAAAMSLVTAWAAELPPASGAKAPARVPAPVSQRLAPSGPAPHSNAVHRSRRAVASRGRP